MQLDIITPDKILFSGTATSVSLPGVSGRFQILENHAPLISNLSEGQIIFDTADGRKTMDVKSGIVEVVKNKVVVLA